MEMLTVLLVRPTVKLVQKKLVLTVPALSVFKDHTWLFKMTKLKQIIVQKIVEQETQNFRFQDCAILVLVSA